MYAEMVIILSCAVTCRSGFLPCLLDISHTEREKFSSSTKFVVALTNSSYLYAAFHNRLTFVIREFTIPYVAHYDDPWRLGHQCNFGDNLVVAHSSTTPLFKFG